MYFIIIFLNIDIYHIFILVPITALLTIITPLSKVPAKFYKYVSADFSGHNVVILKAKEKCYHPIR